MSVNLVNVLWGSEKARCRGLVTGVTAEGRRERAHLQVWCEKGDGTKVTVGSASALQA
jgi:hypothetical protein